MRRARRGCKREHGEAFAIVKGILGMVQALEAGVSLTGKQQREQHATLHVRGQLVIARYLVGSWEEAAKSNLLVTPFTAAKCGFAGICSI